jgi:hypothetical protein
MYFERSIWINRSPEDVFIFLRDKDLYPQKPGSPVLLLDKTTPGEPEVGTRYREIIQMLPFYKGEILSEITRFEPPTYLEEDFCGPGMYGHLAYEFRSEGNGTQLFQRETIRFRGIFVLFEAVIGRVFLPQIEARLSGIKEELETS